MRRVEADDRACTPIDHAVGHAADSKGTVIPWPRMECYVKDIATGAVELKRGPILNVPQTDVA